MNVAFAGFRHNHIFSLYTQATENSNIKILGCFEEDEQTRQNVMRDYNASFNYSTYEEILTDERVEVIAIGDYFKKRGSMVIDALKAGKHVFCDKPICTELGELNEIERLCKEKNLKVCAMLTLRYTLPLVQVKEIISSGEIGEVHIASFTGQHCLDYENRAKWFFEKDKHGGTINDLGIHGIDAIRIMTGKNLTEINAAKAFNAYAPKETNFCDSALFMIQMEDMALTGDVSYSAPKFLGMLPTYWNFHFWGSQGMLTFNYREKHIHIFKDTEIVIDAQTSAPDYWDDFEKELKGMPNKLGTEEFLHSQRQTLEIQKFADKMS